MNKTIAIIYVITKTKIKPLKNKIILHS